jgi:predicted transcriptional regulator
VSFNQRHHRNGHLFQNRYKSISVAEELGMSPSAVSRLIVRAKQVSGHEDIEGTFLQCQ